MEIVLQWLDDLDDLVFVGFMKWESLRRRSLQAGMSSTLMLALCNFAAIALEWVPLLAAVSVFSVALWGIASAGTLMERPRKGITADA
jgi:ABC-type transport system involved in cytochrome c biogenesis permease subunit